MKKLLLFLIFLLSGFSLLFSSPVSENDAMQVALNFLRIKRNPSESSILKLVYKSEKVNLNNDSQSQIADGAYFYIFSRDGNGFVIISGDDASYPILGYSLNSVFNPGNMATNVAKWLESYKEQIRYIIKNKLEPTAEIRNEWINARNWEKSSNQILASVAPLLQTTWDQGNYYNAQCPYDNSAKKRTYTGCVATALAQVLKYWNYPATGSGFHGYNHEKYGYLSANFGSTNYHWSSMPNNVTSTNDAVATLMYHCGVSVEMGYGTNFSGAWVILDNPSKTQYCTENSLKSFFGYDQALKGIKRANYSDNDWMNMMNAELNAGRPILYDGFGGTSGHAFVCDGYNNNYYHFNWGWSGMFDGYFLINQLNPGTGGAGSGEGTYNQYQEMIIGVKPPTNNSKEFKLELYNNVYSNKSTMYYGDSFVISTDVANFGTGTFNGNFCAAVFDENLVFIDYVEILSNYQLDKGMHYTNGLTFTNQGLLSMVPGKYYVFIFYSTDGDNWNIIQGGQQIPNPYCEINVINDNPLQLYTAMTTNPGANSIFKNSPLSVFMNIINYSNQTFYGDLSVALFDLKGEFIGLLGKYTESNGLPYGYKYNNALEYHTDNLNINPGTYLVAGIYTPYGSQTSGLIGTGNYTNPFKIIVQSPALSPDSYEPNNTSSAARVLNPNYSTDQALIKTTGSNIHIDSDIDVYKINFAAGYQYAFAAVIEDAVSVPDGGYSMDAAFSYSFDGTKWSETYDTGFEDAVTFNGPKTVYFRAMPFFSGGTGTYQLDIGLARAPINSIQGDLSADNILIFPNPAKENINIFSGNSNLRIKQIAILDEIGNTLISGDGNLQNSMQVNISNLTNGTYFCKLTSDNGSEVTLKFKVSK